MEVERIVVLGSVVPTLNRQGPQAKNSELQTRVGWVPNWTPKTAHTYTTWEGCFPSDLLAVLGLSRRVLQNLPQQSHPHIKAVLCLAKVSGARVFIHVHADFVHAGQRVHDDSICLH